MFKFKKKSKSVNETIQEIHKTFFTEVDQLLIDANNFNSLESEKLI